MQRVTPVAVDGLLVVAVAALFLARRRPIGRVRGRAEVAWPGTREARPVPGVLRALRYAGIPGQGGISMLVDPNLVRHFVFDAQVTHPTSGLHRGRLSHFV